jgi:hypothetical protein
MPAFSVSYSVPIVRAGPVYASSLSCAVLANTVQRVYSTRTRWIVSRGLHSLAATLGRQSRQVLRDGGDSTESEESVRRKCGWTRYDRETRKGGRRGGGICRMKIWLLLLLGLPCGTDLCDVSTKCMREITLAKGDRTIHENPLWEDVKITAGKMCESETGSIVRNCSKQTE